MLSSNSSHSVGRMEAKEISGRLQKNLLVFYEQNDEEETSSKREAERTADE